MEKKGENYAAIFLKTFLCVLIISILVFICIYIFDITDFPSNHGLVNDENSQTWLKFCIEYFGSVVGSFVGFAGAAFTVLITIKKQNENRREDSRKNVLPLIKVKDKVGSIPPSFLLPDTVKCPDNWSAYPCIDLPDDGETMLQIKLSFKNVGFREMYDIWVGGISFGSKESENYCNIMPILYKGEEYINCLSSAIANSKGEGSVRISFKVYFRDCYDNWYFQIIIGSGYFASGCYVVDRFTVDSAPILVESESLPSAILE